MQFSQLSQILAKIEKINSRLQITQLLSQLWGQLDEREAWQTANLIQGQLRPPYDQLVFNLSEKLIARGLAQLALSEGGLEGGVSVDLFGQADEESLLEQVKKIHRQYGDWGETAADIHRQLFGKVTSHLTINDVYQKLVMIAQLSGDGSQQAKIAELIALLRVVDAESTKIIVRMVISKLRLGFATMTILDSLSWAVCGDKSESKFLESIWQKKADVGLLAKSYLPLKNLTSTERRQQLNNDYHAQIGVPIVPALCQRLNSSTDIIEKMNTVIAEPKYDGLRIQIHIHRIDHESVRVMAFTRSLENVSAMFPELWQFARSVKIKEAIFDSEAVGFNAQTGKMLPFQETMSRRRIHNIESASQEIIMKFFIFDILLLDGQELLTTPLAERKKLLRQTLTTAQQAQMTTFITTDNPDTLHAYHQSQLQAGLEGMVAKGETTYYQSGRKGWNWVKIKEPEGSRGKLNDTLDLLVMGYYYGQGRRHEMGIGAILTGLRDGRGHFVTISKIGTGFTDDNLRELKEMASDWRSDAQPEVYQVENGLTPDVWLIPHLVAEIAADEITRSSLHTSGFGLRFPRILHWRPDKTPDQVTNLDELAQISIDTGD